MGHKARQSRRYACGNARRRRRPRLQATQAQGRHGRHRPLGLAEQFDSDRGGTPAHAGDDSFSHRFTRPGTYTYLCRVHPGQMKGSVEVVELSGLGDTKRPRLTRLRVGPEGRRIAYTLSERAILLLRIQRRARGRWRSMRDFDVFARNGRNRARLPLRGLAPGRYRVRLTAYDDADNASRPPSRVSASRPALHARATSRLQGNHGLARAGAESQKWDGPRRSPLPPPPRR